jgi:hypothetical protein
MAEIFLVSKVDYYFESNNYISGFIKSGSSLPVAAFSIYELAEEYAKERNISYFRENKNFRLMDFSFTKDHVFYKKIKSMNLSFDVCEDSAKIFSQQISLLSDEEILKIINLYDIEQYCVLMVKLYA